VTDQPIRPGGNRCDNRLMTKARARVVTALALVSLVLLVATAVEPDWIEEVFGVEPDAGSGSAEVLVTGAFALLAVVLGVGAVLSWRKVIRRQARSATGD
jgi:hypothetical protein